MKTTLEIDDDLYREAKAVAALTGRKMKDLVSDGLRWVVRPGERKQSETSPTAASKLAACFARADELMKEAPPGPTAREHLNRGAAPDEIMSAVTVDASVWIAAQDNADTFCQPSRDFLLRALSRRVAVRVPALARVEIGCALARKWRDSDQGRQLADQLLETAGAQHVVLDDPLLDRAFLEGTNRFLRGADAVYTATALSTSSTLISWDKEHLKRGGAETPMAWLKANP